MTTMAICIPWRDSDSAERVRAKDFIVKHYAPLGDAILGDAPGPFNVSAARNVAVSQTDADVIVILDADAYVPLHQIERAVQVAWDKGRLVKPFVTAGYLTEEASNTLYETGEVTHDFINPPTRGFVGLAYILRRDVYERLYGFDPNFVGYGGEDNAFCAACDNLLGETKLVDGFGYSLYHPASRVTPQDNVDRVLRYYNIRTWHDYYALRTDI